MNDKEFMELAKWVFGEDIFCPVEKPIVSVSVKNGDYIKVNKPATPKPSVKDNKFEIQSILANKEKGVFTVVWMDGTHTMIHIQDGDAWDDEKALAMCFVKELYDNKSKFNDIFTKIMPAKIKYIGTKDEVEVKSTENPEKIIETKKASAITAKAAANNFSEMAKAVGKKNI